MSLKKGERKYGSAKFGFIKPNFALPYFQKGEKKLVMMIKAPALSAAEQGRILREFESYRQVHMQMSDRQKNQILKFLRDERPRERPTQNEVKFETWKR